MTLPKMRFIGLDFETSGSDIDKGAVPIQLGLAWKDPDDGVMVVHDRFIGGWDFDGEHLWDEDSYRVHNLPRSLIDQAPPAWKVDIILANELLTYVGAKMWNLPVGWNVTGFDMPFIHKWFPNLSRILSYRAVDLTGITLALSGGDPNEYKRIKNLAKTWAAQQIDAEQSWHDAGYDAEAALWAYDWLTTTVIETTATDLVIDEDSFDLDAACRVYTHDYDMLPETQKENARRVIRQILIAGARQ